MVEFVAEFDGVLTATDTDSGITLVSLLLCQISFAEVGVEEEVKEVRGAVFVAEASGMLPKMNGAFFISSYLSS